VRLHVGVVGAEQRRAPVAREVLDLVDHVVAAVVALPRVALGVLVRQHRAGGLEDLARREVLRRDELDGGVLSLELALDDVEQLAVSGGVVRGHSVSYSSYSSLVICSTRRACRPPSNGVASHTRRISSASAGATMRPPMARTLASLCSRDSRAV